MKSEGRFTPERGVENMGGKSWVQDATQEQAEKLIMEKNAQIEREPDKLPKGSRYEIGPSKSGNTNEVGIYFYDPTEQE